MKKIKNDNLKKNKKPFLKLFIKTNSYKIDFYMIEINQK